MSLEEAEEWPSLLEIVRQKVKPNRDSLKRKQYREKWWQFGEKQTALYKAIEQFDSLLVNCHVSSHMAFAYLPADWVYAYSVNVFLLDTKAAFGVLQSRSHEVWARFFASTLEDRLRYNPTDCFDTFPFPEEYSSNSELENIGSKYYLFRSERMQESDEGMTKIYNRFHSPDERDEGILELRRLHGLMDGAVLRAYGWDDLAESARCEFLLDYEEEEDEGSISATGGGKKSKKKKPWRLRWPDPFRDEVLARLLELNEQRAKEEALAGKAIDATEKKKPKRAKRSKKRDFDSDQNKLF